jgi:hypothetical protein
MVYLLIVLLTVMFCIAKFRWVIGMGFISYILLVIIGVI